MPRTDNLSQENPPNFTAGGLNHQLCMFILTWIETIVYDLFKQLGNHQVSIPFE